MGALCVLCDGAKLSAAGRAYIGTEWVLDRYGIVTPRLGLRDSQRHKGPVTTRAETKDSCKRETTARGIARFPYGRSIG